MERREAGFIEAVCRVASCGMTGSTRQPGIFVAAGRLLIFGCIRNLRGGQAPMDHPSAAICAFVEMRVAKVSS